MSKHDSIPLTAERLRSLLIYDPETGVFTRTVSSRSNRAKPGDTAGGLTSDGYISIRVDGKRHKAHRLAWLHVTGGWPIASIDHINGVRADNRFCNLREASNAENCQNHLKAHQNNKTTRRLGVSFKKANKNFVAQISVNGKVLHIGSFSSAETAYAAYIAAKRKLHPFSTV